ncbi:beta-1,3-N-acetylglucosaminyltransferase manic fringe isoform X3 [Pseudochaenichthys georgianus]|uniref:beta-1,3-N-acetylglucosaminyltransferase manic fringe isoform X3 n=1 Tax=Pseudochaenichthys georgianus TaxID=52239 RepID=UPI00146D50CC|nr:beta-1,3-N-acetylglucosaminyltransferase manic fringe isoform X3 [Pseudochaenichthys georgianus]
MQKKKWIRRKLPTCICTFFIILYVDFQLRSSSLPKLSVAHPLVPGPLQRSIQEAPSPARHAQIPGGNSSDSTAGDEGHSDSEDAHVTLPELKLEDIFIAVKTTGRFHETRLALLLETWISRTKAHTFLFTDTEDEDLQSEGYNMVVTACQSDHSQQALSCKMSAEYDGFMASEKSGSRFEQTSARIRLPDDCTVGFIVEKMLGVSMVHCPLFHSHLENLLLISHRSIQHQVTLSYGMFENKMISIEVKGSFSKDKDPSRCLHFLSWCVACPLHCDLLFWIVCTCASLTVVYMSPCSPVVFCRSVSTPSPCLYSVV